MKPLGTALIPTPSLSGVGYRLIFQPVPGRPMQVVVFASGGGGNLQAAIDLAREEPDVMRVGLVITDRPNIPAIQVAERYGIPALVYDFEARCGRWAECRHDPVEAAKYWQATVRFHDMVLQELREVERQRGRDFDLAVLSYRRWIHGDLLDYFADRMINQHPGDLAVFRAEREGERAYTGIHPVYDALVAGESRTRTSTILVSSGHDAGEILCQGPWTVYKGGRVTRARAAEHEQQQKRISDWPSLRFALSGIATGLFAVSERTLHADGCRTILYDGQPLPYAGVSLE